MPFGQQLTEGCAQQAVDTPLKLTSHFQCNRDATEQHFDRGGACCVRIGGHRAGGAGEETTEAFCEVFGEPIE